MAKNKPLLSDSERLSVNQAISAAERRTAAEIVPAVARASGRYDRPEDIVGLWIGILACGVTYLVTLKFKIYGNQRVARTAGDADERASSIEGRVDDPT